MKIRNGFVSNSSSEAFICNTKLNIKEVKEILQKTLDFYNDIFNENITFEETFKDPRLCTEADLSYLKGWDYHYNKDDLTKIIIYSETDNSIPYCIFYIIEEKFGAWRYHLG